EFAVYIEQNGYTFYNETKNKFDDQGLQDLFQFLGDEELKHEKTFKALVKQAGTFTFYESYAGEYSAYMRDFLKMHALGNDEALKNKIAGIKDAAGAVAMALEFEKDSIVLFTMLKKYISGSKGEGFVDNIIQEELTHIYKINSFYSQLKKR
ncbi:ferritin family protein, partial [Acidobacteriota bacterium]